MSLELSYDYENTTALMEKFSQKDIEDLRQWTQNLDTVKYVPKDLTNKQLVLFYNACESDMEKTKICIEKYYLYKKNAPEFFTNRILTSEYIIPSLEALEFAYFPGQTPEGYDIIFHRLHHTEPSKYFLEIGVKLLFMTVDACLHRRGPQRGHVFLFDMRGVKLGHILRLSLNSLRKFFQFVQEAAPIHMRAVHILNTEPVVDKLMLVIKPFMNKDLYDMIKFHPKNEDMEKFYKTVIPRSALPSDFGGDLPDTQTLHQRCMKDLQELEPYFTAEEAQRAAAMPQKKEQTLDSSFKKLDID